MGRIVVHQNITLDGVIEDPTGDEGFEFGGWFDLMPGDTREQWAAAEFAEAKESAAWLIGRGTYTWFAERWATRDGVWADRLRELTKYVVSATLRDTDAWENTVVLTGDVIEEVTKVRELTDGDIVVYGSAPLVRMLFANDLVDELRLMTHPFLFGTGERLFRDLGGKRELELVGMRQLGTLALLTYQPVR